MAIIIATFLTLPVPEKLKNLIFEIPIIPQNLNINNYRITMAKSINLDIVRKLIKYSCEGNVRVKEMFILINICLFSRYYCSNEGRYYYRPNRVQRSKAIKKDCSYRKNCDIRLHDADLQHSFMK